MAKNYSDEDGVWRTIGGRRVFIKNGQSLSDAMKESGKFSRVAKNQDLYKKLDEEKKKDVIEDKKVEKKKETTSFEEIKDEMERATDYEDLYNACDKIEDPNLRKEVEEAIDTAQSDGFSVEEASSTITSDYIDTKAMQGEKNGGDDFRQKALEDDKIRLSTKYESPNGTQLNVVAQDVSGRYIVKEAGNEYRATEQELKDIIKDGQYTKSEYSGVKKEKESDISPMSEWSDTTGTGRSDLQDKEIAKRVKENKIVDSYGNNVIYQNEKGNWLTSREQYNKYVNGESERLGGELILNEKEGRKALASYDAMDKVPYTSYLDDEKTGKGKQRDELQKQTLDKMYKSIGYDDSKENYGYVKKDDYKLNKDGSFTQETQMYGGTREYSPEQVKEMQEKGVRPMKSSYTGGGWEGLNSNKNLTTSEQGKAITDAMKKKYPDVKITRRTDNYSMGSSIDFNIMSSDKDLFVSDADIDKMENFGRLTTSYEFERWAKDNVKGFSDTNRTYTTDDQRRYAKEVLNNAKKRDIQSPRGDEWYLSDYGKSVIKDLNREANSYTYDDSDGMVDYFDHGTYMHINIGKWDKPYQVNEKSSGGNQITNALKSKAYQNYMKQHPNSKMTFEEFKNR